MKRDSALEQKITSILKKKFPELRIGVIYTIDKRSQSNHIDVFLDPWNGEVINKTVKCLRRFWNVKEVNRPLRNLWNRIIGRERQTYMIVKPFYGSLDI